jgi:hypothetical protein
MSTFLNAFYSLFLTKKFPILVISRKKPFHPILHTNEVIPKAQRALKKRKVLCNLIMEKPSWV